MKKNNKAFTLVELIVVITILAILGTIAFINLQGYSTSARDGKRVSDINNIMKKIGIESSKGTSLSTLITTTKTNSGLTINGQVGSSIQGTANFLALKEDGNSFKDPVTKGDYVLSYSVGGTGTGAYKFNQVSTVNEEENTAVVKGNYYLMQPSDSPSIIYNPDSTYFVVDGGVDLPYVVQEGTLVNNTPPPVVCNYDQADIDVLNGEIGNTMYVSDINWDSLAGPLTKEQWCDDVYALDWYGGSTIIPEIFTLNLLQYLGLNYNSITSIPPEIGNLENLKVLSLGGNPLTNLTGIDNFTSLTELHANDCGLLAFPTEVLALTNLEVLDLDTNSIQTIPSSIATLTNLKNLNISRNLFTSLPSEIGSMISLENLSLIGTSLTSLPTWIGNLTNLTYLNANLSSITSLPSEIGNLTNLIYLSVGLNDISSIPSSIGNLVQLNSLSLGGNNISTIPVEIGNLTQLQSLELNNNSISIIPSSIGNLVNLNYIDLSYNSITTIPSTIGNLVNLVYLYLRNNSLTTLPQELTSLNNIYELNLLNNLASLGQLSYYFDMDSLNRSQSGIPTGPQTMTIGGNGSNVVISVTP
ncbi:MAG: leucine-rich repeat domain-containing protein [Candidatus Gracilibacteria bacterium]|nr:leucine-rich repeat domain-containing protein [Candidatus Gracilibacteria bacterium]